MTVSRFSPDYRASVQRTSYDGDYRLLPAQISPDGHLQPEQEPLKLCKLRRGQRLGFIQSSDGPIVAVAGDESFQLQEGRAYVWEMRATPGQIDPVKTALLVFVVGATVAIVITSLSTVDLGTSGSGAFYP